MKGVLVLNANFDYWDEVSVRRAILKIIKGKVRVVAHNGKLMGVTPEGQEIWMPLIIQLPKWIGFKCKSTKVHFSDGAVYDRDSNYCQYWHHYRVVNGIEIATTKPYKYRCTEEDRTIDHVIPLSQGGRNNFENTVCACRYCNEILKKNWTPEETGLRLIRKPFEPTREIGEMVHRRFNYNPKKPSHREYVKIRYGGVWE